jgi:hypothetical protein
MGEDMGEFFSRLNLFEEFCIKKFTVSYSRAPNLRSELTRAKLHQAPGKEASKYYDGELAPD